jgi:cathepsin D
MIKLYNYKDVQYSGNIYVGTPYNKFTVIYDTGSNLFWLPSVNCTFKCRNSTNKYNPKLSSTSEDMHIKKNISYAKGYIKGRLYKEKIFLNKKSKFSFLYSKELSLDNFKLIAVYKEKYLLFHTIFDGIVGLMMKEILIIL